MHRRSTLLNEKELVRKLKNSFKELQVSNENWEEIVRDIFRYMRESLAEGNFIALKNFGNFSLRRRKSYTRPSGIVPEGVIHVPEEIQVIFTPSVNLHDDLQKLLKVIKDERITED